MASFAKELGPGRTRRGISRSERARERKVLDPELLLSPSELLQSATLRKDPGPSGKDRVTERRKGLGERKQSGSIAKESGGERRRRRRVARGCDAHLRDPESPVRSVDRVLTSFDTQMRAERILDCSPPSSGPEPSSDADSPRGGLTRLTVVLRSSS